MFPYHINQLEQVELGVLLLCKVLSLVTALSGQCGLRSTKGVIRSLRRALTFHFTNTVIWLDTNFLIENTHSTKTCLFVVYCPTQDKIWFHKTKYQPTSTGRWWSHTSPFSILGVRTRGEPAELTQLSGNCFSTATSFSLDSRAKEQNQLGLLLVEPEGRKAGERRWRKLEEEDHPVLAALSYQMGSVLLLVLTLPVALRALGRGSGAASHWDGLIVLKNSTLNLFEDLAFFPSFP